MLNVIEVAGIHKSVVCKGKRETWWFEFFGEFENDRTDLSHGREQIRTIDSVFLKQLVVRHVLSHILQLASSPDGEKKGLLRDLRTEFENYIVSVQTPEAPQHLLVRMWTPWPPLPLEHASRQDVVLDDQQRMESQLGPSETPKSQKRLL